ncbi:MAG: hypothetical protein OHK0022_21850 [Roseiflexaceae bacterium]
MSINPEGTQWLVAAMDNDGHIQDFHPVPWEFHNPSLNAGTIWSGGYTPIPGTSNGFHCELIVNGVVNDSWDVYFVSPDRFIGVKDGSIYRFGKKV